MDQNNLFNKNVVLVPLKPVSFSLNEQNNFFNKNFGLVHLKPVSFGQLKSAHTFECCLLDFYK